MIISISTGMPFGSPAMPTAERAVAREKEQVADPDSGNVVAERLGRRGKFDPELFDPGFCAHGRSPGGVRPCSGAQSRAEADEPVGNEKSSPATPMKKNAEP